MGSVQLDRGSAVDAGQNPPMKPLLTTCPTPAQDDAALPRQHVLLLGAASDVGALSLKTLIISAGMSSMVVMARLVTSQLV